MPTFAIGRGSSPLCTWDINTGKSTINPRAIQRDMVLILGEADKLFFVFDTPADEMEYRISIGDFSLSEILPVSQDAEGVVLNGQLYWREFQYFESARGSTRIMLEARHERSSHEMWKVVFAEDVYILPSKLGEDRYQHMSDDLETLSRSLLVDLYGKSKQTHDLRYAKEGIIYHSREHELTAIATVLERIGILLDKIRHRAASRVKTVSGYQNYWGGERLYPASINYIASHGIDLLSTQRPLTIRTNRRMESFDIPEHRVIKAFLNILIHRANYCADVAHRHINAISKEQYLRHIRIGDGPTIYESVDLPKIKRLRDAIKKADRSVILISELEMLPFLKKVQPELVALKGGTFQRNGEYELLLAIIRRFLLKNSVWYKGDGMSEVTKLTSRLYEQWCYLQIIEAFRACGLDLREWNDALRENLQSRFVLDFDRGLSFEGALGNNLRLRFRYEPWILGEKSAVQTGETLCRGYSSDVAWCPDIVIECLYRDGNNWRPIYGIILDCKYTTKINIHHWAQTSKYLEIRSTVTRRQVVRQLWLVSPGNPHDVSSEDPAVSFGQNGPSCAPDEAVRFRLVVSPGEVDEKKERKSTNILDPFVLFARGTLSFLRKHFEAYAVNLNK